MLLRQFNPCPQKTYPCSGDGILVAQPSNLIGAKSTIKTIAEVHSRCPKWVAILPISDVRRGQFGDKTFAADT
jgi:hypothetical protein